MYFSTTEPLCKRRWRRGTEGFGGKNIPILGRKKKVSTQWTLWENWTYKAWADIELSFCHFPHHYHHKRAEKSLVSNQCPIVSHSTHCCQWSECPLNLSLSFPSSASLLDIVNTRISIVFADTHNIRQHKINAQDYSCCDWHIDNQKWFAAQIFVNIGEYNTPVTKLLIVNLSSTNQM